MTNGNQAATFLNGEGDAWYARNHRGSTADAVDVSYLKTVLRPFASQIESVLDIGCSHGGKCHDLATFLDAKAFGIDPSSAAIDRANQLYASGDWQVGVAHQLPYPDQSFQVVIVGFCLYLVDRIHLYRCISEVDRVLVSGGFLGIVDFHPQHPHRRPYHHVDGLYTYKSNYDQCFTATGLYTMIGKQSFSHHGPSFELDQNERISVSVCYKEPDPYPLIGASSS